MGTLINGLQYAVRTRGYGDRVAGFPALNATFMALVVTISPMDGRAHDRWTAPDPSRSVGKPTPVPYARQVTPILENVLRLLGRF